jgi:TRAP-type uncharacterized transport system fused permease subunit
MTNKNIKRARGKVDARKKGGIPNWLYMTLSFLIPIYGLLYWLMLNKEQPRRAKIGLILAVLGIFVIIVLKLLVFATTL